MPVHYGYEAQIDNDADDYRGLSATVDAAIVTLYATRNGGSGANGGGELVSLVDTSGYNAPLAGSPQRLATAGALAAKCQELGRQDPGPHARRDEPRAALAAASAQFATSGWLERSPSSFGLII